MLAIFWFLASVAFFASLSDAYVWSEKTVTIGYGGITNSSTFLYDDDLIVSINTKFPGLNVPLGSLTYNISLYQLSHGLRPTRRDPNGPLPNPIGIEYGFFVPPGQFVIYHKIFGKHLTLPRGETGEFIMTVGADPLQPFQLLPYTMDTGELITNEGILTTAIMTAMADVTHTSGIFSKFSNGHVRINSMTNVDPLSFCNGTSFVSDCIYIAKFDLNGNVFLHDSFTWPFW